MIFIWDVVFIGVDIEVREGLRLRVLVWESEIL